VQMRFIGDLDPHGGKCIRQLVRDCIAHGHVACDYGSAVRQSRVARLGSVNQAG
jgi:hypothetical protein